MAVFILSEQRCFIIPTKHRGGANEQIMVLVAIVFLLLNAIYGILF